MVMGRQDYHWKHEPCLYGWKDGAAHLWASDRKQVTVIECKRPSKSELHPTMKPYTVLGVEYYPTVVRVGDYFEGIASWYGPNFHGKLTSSGEEYDMYSMTAAHKTLPMNTVVKVYNRGNGMSVNVRINDRGPFVETRIIDLSFAAAQQLGVDKTGTALVSLEVLGFEPNGAKSIDTKKLAQGPQESVLNSFFVQVGVFEKFEGALRTKQEYGKINGYSAIIKDTEDNGKRVFRIWLSGFKSEAEARDFIARNQFDGAFIVRE